jgi:predicted dinucleotide-binding enzyme
MGLRCRCPARIITQGNIGYVLVRRIKCQPRDIKIRNHASASDRIQTGERRGTRGGEPERAIVVADNAVVIVLWGYADGTDGNTTDQRRLANDDIGRPLGARAV